MYERVIGSRAQVYHGTALKTKGGLTKAKLFKNKHGRYVSRKKHFSAKRKNNLIKHGYGFQKGKFGYVKLDEKNDRKTRKHSRKHRGSKRRMRGGFSAMESKTAFSPASYSGEGQGLSGNSVNVQFAAGRGN